MPLSRPSLPIRLCLGALLWHGAVSAAVTPAWQRFFAGNGDVTVEAVAVAPNGEIYLAGSTTTADLPGTAPGSVVHGAQDAFVARLGADGSALGALVFGVDLSSAFATQEAGLAVAVGPQGRVYLTGTLRGPVAGLGAGFTPTVDCRQTQADAFVLVLDVALRPLRLRCFGAENRADAGRAIAVDAQGDVYVAGETTLARQTNNAPADRFPTVSGVSSPSPETVDGFFVRLSDPLATNSDFVGVRLFSGQGTERLDGLAIAANGRVVVVGTTNSADFPAVNGLAVTMRGDNDAFVVELAADGSMSSHALVFGGASGGAGPGGLADDAARAVAIDAAGGIVVAGETGSTDLPVTDGSALAGVRDAFVLRLRADWSVDWLRYLGGPADDLGRDLVLDGAGLPVLVGLTTSPGLPAADNAYFGGQDKRDIFLSRLDAAGGVVQTRYLGGIGDEIGVVVGRRPNGAPLVAGTTLSTTLEPPASGASRSVGGRAGLLIALDTVVTSTGTGAGGQATGGAASSAGSGGQATRVGDATAGSTAVGGGGGASILMIFLWLLMPAGARSGRIRKVESPWGMVTSPEAGPREPRRPYSHDSHGPDPRARGGEC